MEKKKGKIPKTMTKIKKSKKTFASYTVLFYF